MNRDVYCVCVLCTVYVVKIVGHIMWTVEYNKKQTLNIKDIA